MLEENIKNRDITDALVGKNVRGLYEDLWFIGDKEYFNTNLQNCKVIYPNETSNCIIKDYFDGVQVTLLQVKF